MYIVITVFTTERTVTVWC